MEIAKKSWPENFNALSSGEKKAEIRLADFDIKAGDTVVLREYNPKEKKFTGRELKKKCKRVEHITAKDTQYGIEGMKSHGVYLIEYV